MRSPLALLALALLTGEAVAHDAPTGWTYPIRCCSGTDCNRVDASRVSEGQEGYRVVLRPGDHDFIKEPASFLIPYSKAEPSEDSDFHICINPALTVLCWFVPPRGS